MAIKHLVPFLVLPLAGCLTSGSSDSLAPSAGLTALGGGLIGQNPVAAQLPSEVKAKALAAEFQALQYAPAGQPVVWADDGIKGEVVSTQPYRIGSQDCRGYTHTIEGAGQPIKAVGAACKTPNGYWKPVA